MNDAKAESPSNVKEVVEIPSKSLFSSKSP